MDPNERVLCVPTKALEDVGVFQGFKFEWEKYVHNFLRTDVAFYAPRGEIEEDPSIKQIIPYLTFVYTDPQGKRWRLRYNRTKQSGEGRLRGKASIGIGGHITEMPGESPQDTFNQQWHRELSEETRIDAIIQASHIGVLNDDQDEVGKVHFGVVMEISVSLPCVYPADETTQEMYFTTGDRLYMDRGEFEGWSKICIEALCHQITGFDVVKFDKEYVKSPDGKSLAEVVEERWGKGGG